MAVGKGKYDDALGAALLLCGAEQGVFIVFDGKQGSGFSVMACKEALEGLPHVLEHIAQEVRKDLPNLT